MTRRGARWPAIALVGLVLASCQSARQPPPASPAPQPSTTPSMVAVDVSPPEEVALWALLAPADLGRGAAGKPAPVLRGVAPASRQDAAPAALRAPEPAAPPRVTSAPARTPDPAPAMASRASPPATLYAGAEGLPRYVPARAPAGTTYRPDTAAGALSGDIYDRSNPQLDLLQRPRDALTGLPAARGGGVDWVLALQQGAISPRAGLESGASMELRDSDIVMRDTASMPWVLFPHRRHTEWLSCSNCHPRPFAPRVGANDVKMDDIFRGRWCGQCHDRVAFPTLTCERCHNVLHEASPRAWWEVAAP